MSDFLGSLIANNLVTAETIRPRPISRFEPRPPALHRQRAAALGWMMPGPADLTAGEELDMEIERPDATPLHPMLRSPAPQERQRTPPLPRSPASLEANPRAAGKAEPVPPVAEPVQRPSRAPALIQPRATAEATEPLTPVPAPIPSVNSPSGDARSTRPAHPQPTFQPAGSLEAASLAPTTQPAPAQPRWPDPHVPAQPAETPGATHPVGITPVVASVRPRQPTPHAPPRPAATPEATQPVESTPAVAPRVVRPPPTAAPIPERLTVPHALDRAENGRTPVAFEARSAAEHSGTVSTPALPRTGEITPTMPRHPAQTRSVENTVPLPAQVIRPVVRIAEPNLPQPMAGSPRGGTAAHARGNGTTAHDPGHDRPDRGAGHAGAHSTRARPSRSAGHDP